MSFSSFASWFEWFESMQKVDFILIKHRCSMIYMLKGDGIGKKMCVFYHICHVKFVYSSYIHVKSISFYTKFLI